MPLKVNLIFSGFLIVGAIFLSGALLSIPEILSAQADLLSRRSAVTLEMCLGFGLLFLFATLASLLGRVFVLEREIEKLKTK